VVPKVFPVYRCKSSARGTVSHMITMYYLQVRNIRKFTNLEQ